MGVRISWLMLARNADFRRSLSSACSLAAMSSASIFFLLGDVFTGADYSADMTFLIANWVKGRFPPALLSQEWYGLFILYCLIFLNRAVIVMDDCISYFGVEKIFGGFLCYLLIAEAGQFFMEGVNAFEAEASARQNI